MSKQQNSKFVVGLTGGIGSGKSTVAKLFAALGINIINADQLSREVVALGQPSLRSIAEHFGAEVLTTEGALNRAALRKIIFSDEQQKDWLEALLHPLIVNLIKIRISESLTPYCILESPLLLESEQHRLTHRVLVIDVDEKTQFVRAIERDGSDAATIRSIIAAQLARKERIAMADDIIQNEGGIEELQEKIAALHRNYITLANSND